jgi:diguanylate cyclase (GGDEF)-like protein
MARALAAPRIPRYLPRHSTLFAAGENLWNTSQNQWLAPDTITHILVAEPWETASMNLVVILASLLTFSAVCYMLLSARLLGGKRDNGSLPLAAMFCIVGLWVLGGAIELIGSSYLVFSIGRVGHFVGTALVPVALLICFREYTGSETSRSTIIALLIVPTLSIVLAATNYWHEFMWYLPAVNEAGAFLTRPRAWGPWFLFVHAPYAYGLVGVAISTLLLHSSAVARAQRRGLFLLGGSAIAPVIAAVAYDFGVGPNTVSTLPIVFAMMLPVYAWLIIAEQVTEFSPVAYETVFQNMQDPVIVIDDQQRIIGLNHGAEALLDMKEQDALRESLDKVFGMDVTEVRAALETGLPQKMLTNSGRFLHLQVTPIATNKAAARTGRVLMFRDVSDVEKAQREVQNSEKLLRTLIDHSVNGIIRFRWVAGNIIEPERSLRCIFANAAAGRFLNADARIMIDQTAEEILTLATNGMDERESETLLEEFMDAARAGRVADSEAQVEIDRAVKWLRVIGEPVGDDVAITFVDITDRKAKELQMESIALSDPLTGVLNRRGFERDAARRLSSSNDDATGALLFIDLNDFKQINDKYGHEIGDELLTIAAERLRTSLRSCDIIGRPGGDEFVALVPDVKAKIAEKLATRLTSCLEQPYLIGNKKLDCPASIGLALYPDNASTLTGLLRAADAAMYRAKARCRGADSISDTDLLEKAV